MIFFFWAKPSISAILMQRTGGRDSTSIGPLALTHSQISQLISLSNAKLIQIQKIYYYILFQPFNDVDNYENILFFVKVVLKKIEYLLEE